MMGRFVLYNGRDHDGACFLSEPEVCGQVQWRASEACSETGGLFSGLGVVCSKRLAAAVRSDVTTAPADRMCAHSALNGSK